MNHFGLSAFKDDGCSACLCHLGGSDSERCDNGTGECKCRENFVGRTCNRLKHGYYIPSLATVMKLKETNDTEIETSISESIVSLQVFIPPI